MALDQVIRRHRFTRFCEHQMGALVELSAAVEFEEGAMILKEGQPSEYLYLLDSGSVAVELRTPRFTACVQALVPGEPFGWSAQLDHQASSLHFQVRAREPVTALRLSGKGLTQLCRKDNPMGTELLLRTLSLVAHRIKATEECFAEMCGVRVPPT